MKTTIELVLVGHPDKVCDGIAEEIKKKNPGGRNAIEVSWGEQHNHGVRGNRQEMAA
jgi:S-adenosylmethionine synthetase